MIPKFRDTEFTLKNFRQAKNRRDFWFEYQALLNNANQLWIYLSSVIDDEYDENGNVTKKGKGFVGFLKTFVDGDLSVIEEAEKEESNYEDLFVFVLEVATHFLLSNKDFTKKLTGFIERFQSDLNPEKTT